jgi:NhaA family Na+:H+ antiporter
MAVRRTRLTQVFTQFFKSNQSGGMLLLLCTAISLFLTNTFPGAAYQHFWEIELGPKTDSFHLHQSLAEWINDGLMTVFFLLVGLEIRRELYVGELSSRKKALLPVMGALGGMVVPALFYFVLNINSPETISGIGIPTATDIAFAIAIMGALGDKVPPALKVFLTALAIIDDLGAIVIIAVFYGSGFSIPYLLLTAGLFGFLLLLNKLKVHSLAVYLSLGLVLWFLMLHSGVHATLAGVLLAFAIPFQRGDKEGASHRLEEWLQRPVALLIIPLFALANTAIAINGDLLGNLGSAESLGIMLGLVLGKPIGIFTAALLSQKLKIAEIAHTINKPMLWGAGMLGGIGFTMAIFVTNLAFDQAFFIELGKVSILLASTIAAVGGYFVLSTFSKR